MFLRLFKNLRVFAGAIAKRPYKKPLRFSGDHSGGETPVPIPNTAVKPARADGTPLFPGLESRSLPGVNKKSPLISEGIFLFPNHYFFIPDYLKKHHFSG